MLMHDRNQLDIVPAPGVEDLHETGGVQDGFQFPLWIWIAMVAAYGLFFVAITAATGRTGSAIFAIVISIGYVAIFFGLAAVIANVGGREKLSPLAFKDGALQTWTGPMDIRTVAGQVLIVPACISLFAVGILIVRWIVFP